MAIDRALDQAVRRRARDRCEYCRLLQSDYPFRFPIDHIIAQQHDGETALWNLALACVRCNRHKGPNLSGRDPVTRRILRLFNPRRDRWAEHFEWAGSSIVGRTAKGRATVHVLVMNDPADIAIREARHGRAQGPPSGE